MALAQYLVHFNGKANFEDALISPQELKKINEVIWKELTIISKLKFSQAKDNNIRA